MKKLLIIFTVCCSFFTINSFAQDKTPDAVTQSLQASFKNVKDVSWSEVNNLYKAAFVLEGQNITVYFNQAGKIVASARNVTLLQLPILLRADISNNYKDFTVSNIFEIDNDEGVAYYITLENATRNLNLKSNDYGTWGIYQSDKVL